MKQVTSRRCFVSNNNIYIDEIGKKVFGLETSHDEEMNECRLLQIIIWKFLRISGRIQKLECLSPSSKNGNIHVQSQYNLRLFPQN